MSRNLKFWILLFVAFSLGLLIALIDSSPNWDDTGITVAMILAVTIIVAYLHPVRPWVWALAVGVWIPIIEIFSSGNFGSLMALIFGFIGAYLGFYISKKTTNR